MQLSHKMLQSFIIRDMYFFIS